LWEYLSADNWLILRPVPSLAVRRQLSGCTYDNYPAKSPRDPHHFQLD
jgi:hypothetical protein